VQAGSACASGSAGRPDLMSTAPIAGAPADPVHDQSTDVTRNAAGGRVLMRDDRAGGCADPGTVDYAPSEADVRKYAAHSWATPATTVPSETATTGGRAVVSLWTQSADQAAHPGRLCVVLRRQSTGAVLGQADFDLMNWPSAPTQLSIAFDLAHATLPAGERLLLSLRVPSDSGADVGVLFDHPSYQSRLTITSAIGKELK
jgi:hypothetical protein